MSLLRFLLIVIGGTSGLYGISLAIAAVAVNAASMQTGECLTSAPFLL